MWIAASASLLAALFALLTWAGVGPWSNHLKRTARIARTVNTAQVQIGQGEYESAFLSYQDALKVDPSETTLLDRQLESGLARTDGRGSRASDILAHLGWTHWLHQKMAYQEFGSAAEQGMRRALAVAPS